MVNANNTHSQYEGIKQMGFYAGAERNRMRKKHGLKHWWAIVLQKDKPNHLECIKCHTVCQTQEQYEGNCNV